MRTKMPYQGFGLLVCKCLLTSIRIQSSSIQAQDGMEDEYRPPKCLCHPVLFPLDVLNRVGTICGMLDDD